MTVMDILRSLKQGFPSVLWLYGPEQGLIEEVIRRYTEQYNVRDMNYTPLDLSLEKETDFIHLLSAPPFMAPKRLIVLRPGEEVIKNKNWQDQLLEILTDFPEYIALIIIGEGAPDKRSKLGKLISEKAIVGESRYLNDQERSQWLRREIRRNSIAMENAAVMEFLLRCGPSLAELQSELNKLIAFRKDSHQSITAELVEDIVIASPEFNVFRLVDALGNKQIKNALQELELLWANNEQPLSILGMIGRQIRLIYKTKLLQAAQTRDTEMAKELATAPFVVRKLQQQARNYTLEQLEERLKSLRRLEREVKTGALDAKYGIELWILGYNFPADK